MAANLNRSQRAEYEQQAWLLRRMGKSVYTIAALLAKPVAEGGLAITLDHSSVSRALARVEKKLHAEFVKAAEEIKARQKEQLEHLQELAMEEFERSRENAEMTRTATKELGAKAPVGEERDPQPHGGELQRHRRMPLEGEEPRGFYLNHDTGDETTDDEKAALLAQGGKSGEHPLTVIERNTTEESRGQTGDPRYLAEARAAMSDIRDIYGLNAPKPKDENLTPVIVKVYQNVDVEEV